MLHRNLPLKVAAFALAIFLWFWVVVGEERRLDVSGLNSRNTNRVEASESRPVELAFVGEPPPGYELTGVNASPKVVRLSGSPGRVDQTARLLVTVDLGEVVPDVAAAWPVSAVDDAGEKVEGVSVAPPEAVVVVSMRPAMSPRTVPVVLRTEGALAADLKIASVKIDPSIVTILGPAGQVVKVDRVETEPLALDRVQNSSTESLKLLIPEGVELLSVFSVSVSLNIERVGPEAPAREEDTGG